MFYHLERSTLDTTLPLLLEKTLQRGWKAVVQPSSLARVAALDTHLWVWKDEAFLPHASSEDPAFTDSLASQPIVLTAAADNPNEAEVLFLVDGAKREAVDGFTRCIVIFDGRDEEALAAARQYWSALKDAKYPLTYWQEKERGKWEKGAEANTE